MVLQHLVGKIILNEAQLDAADVDGNGVSITSARLILQFLVDKISEFPREEELVSGNERGNTAGNISNSGLAAIQGDWIYYFNLEGDWEGGLYRKRLDGSGKQKLLSDIQATYINVVGNWVYCVDNLDTNREGSGGIWRVRTDGSSKKKISTDFAFYMSVIGGWIYYSKQHFAGEYTSIGIYRMKTDGSAGEKLSDDHATYLNVVDDWIYYSKVTAVYYEEDNYDDYFYTFEIYRIKTDGSAKEKLSDEDRARVTGINVVEDGVGDYWIYYVTYLSGRTTLYRMRTDGSDRRPLLSSNDDKNRLIYINVVGEWIYFADESQVRKLYRVNTDGSDKQVLSDDAALLINIVGDWIYYRAFVPGMTGAARMLCMKLDGSERQLLD
ncbi:MAG: DUF5050 domain-containing protein [Oscillospiraceae bacterium]|nr:DUF5050 domain-containing protein [Oscillospiraceae bacterium]